MVKYQYLLLWNVLTFTFSFTSANPWDPKPRTDDWGKQRHAEFIASSKKDSASIKVVFYGESLVEEFSSTGKDVWQKHYSNLHAVNYGIGGDNCENVIWRIQEAEVNGLNVEVVVLMIGTTNLPFSSAKDIAKGIKTIVDLLLEKMPHTKVLLLGVLPRQDKDYKDKIKELNSDLSTFDNGKNIRFLDMTSHFSDADHINKEMYNTDGFHLSKGGYIAWAETMDPLLHKMIVTQPSTKTPPIETINAKTTRYWDCCKPACAWPRKAGETVNGKAVNSCSKDGHTVIESSIVNVCGGGGVEVGGPAFICDNHQPWAINDSFSLGFVAAKIPGSSDWCCACFEFTFTSTSAKGLKMVVQATNQAGGSLEHFFDMQIPGGGVGGFNGCAAQHNAPKETGWGDRYGGVKNKDECKELPEMLQPGCNWRFDWLKGGSNPDISYRRVACPHSLVKKSACQRTDDKYEDQMYANL